MTTITDMINRWQELDVLELSKDAMIEGREEIVQLNRDQLFAGLNSEGDRITPPYRLITTAQKREKGQPTDRVTLKDTGEFYSKFYLMIQGNSFDINSSDSKTGGLSMKYSGNGDIFGLTSESKRVAYTEIVKPSLVRSIKDLTGAR